MDNLEEYIDENIKFMKKMLPPDYEPTLADLDKMLNCVEKYNV